MDTAQPATARQVVRRLFDARLLAAEQAVDGRVAVRNVSRSNGVFAVSADGVEYVVKGPGLAATQSIEGLDREARFYDRTTQHPELGAAPVPRLLGRTEGLLVLERTVPGATLDDRQRLRGPSSEDMRLLGRALGTWRRLSSLFAELDLPARIPWALESLERRPPPVVAESPGAMRLADAVRIDGALCEGLAGLRTRWRRDAVIHGDVRWDNALVESDPLDGRERVVLVDWELIGWGDAGWDVAGALADAVVLDAVTPVESPPGDVTYQRATSAQLAGVTSALDVTARAFADGYRAEAPPETVERDLESGLRLLPARVLNVAFLNAAWNPDSGLSSGLALAGVAAAMLAENRS